MNPRSCFRSSLLLLATAVLLGAAGVAGAQTTQPAGPATQPGAPGGALPFVKVDVKNKTVDLEAAVVLREGKWLELFACKPKTREHETILTVSALPSHVHLALLMIGLEPGSPLSWREVDGNVQSIPPKGPGVSISVITQVDGKAVEVPASAWILNQKTNEPIPDQPWLFVGSRSEVVQGKSIYYADMNGSVISLVNFGDDVLVRETPMTNENDNSTFGANTKAIPAVGTAVIVRLRPAPAAGAAAGKAGALEKPAATTQPAR